MAINAVHLSPTVRMLSEHLDMVLAAGEDLADLTFEAQGMCATGVTSQGDVPSLKDFVARIKRFERAAAMRVLTARDRAEELAEDDARFKNIVGLFLGGTHPLADAVPALAASESDDVCADAYLRSRGALAPDAAGLDGFSPLCIGEDFRIGGTVELGVLMDLTASFLDAIEIHYDVFPDADEDDTLAGTAMTEPDATGADRTGSQQTDDGNTAKIEQDSTADVSLADAIKAMRS